MDAERVELVSLDPARVGRVVPGPRIGRPEGGREKLVDLERAPLAVDGHGPEGAHDTRAKRRLLAELSQGRRLERLSGLDMSSGKGPGALARGVRAADEEDSPAAVDDDDAYGERAARLVLRKHGRARIVAAMLGRELAVPLEGDWQDTLDRVARSRGWPTSREVPRLAAKVAELSEAYNDPDRARAAAKDAGAARLGFAFARDVPKGAGAVRELVVVGALRVAPEAPLRLLDVGAGLGAMTWGVVRALEAAGATGRVEATWVDADALALDVGAAVVAARTTRNKSSDALLELRVRRLRRPLESLGDLGAFDLVVLGNVLSELDVGLDADERVSRHVALVRGLLDRHVGPAGSLVIVEPALRARSRHLHAIRDACAALGATVFAPCLHAAPCPALARESDWCHEDLPVDLPPWLVPVARAAGLRREGLSFSYVVLRKDSRSLAAVAGEASPGSTRLRVVSGPMPTKGKREAYLCGAFADGVGRARGVRLDRDASAANAAWATVERGDVLSIDPAPKLDRARVGAQTSVRSVQRSGAFESR